MAPPGRDKALAVGEHEVQFRGIGRVGLVRAAGQFLDAVLENVTKRVRIIARGIELDAGRRHLRQKPIEGEFAVGLTLAQAEQIALGFTFKRFANLIERSDGAVVGEHPDAVSEWMSVFERGYAD